MRSNQTTEAGTSQRRKPGHNEWAVLIYGHMDDWKLAYESLTQNVLHVSSQQSTVRVFAALTYDPASARQCEWVSEMQQSVDGLSDAWPNLAAVRAIQWNLSLLRKVIETLQVGKDGTGDMDKGGWLDDRTLTCLHACANDARPCLTSKPMSNPMS